MELLENLHPVVALLAALFVVVWIVLLLLVPFMIESIRSWTRKQHDELREINQRLERLITLFGHYANAAQRGESPANDAPGGRREARKEPTISEHVPIAPKPEPRIAPEPGGPRQQPRNPHARTQR